jgi:hypothetical protein
MDRNEFNVFCSRPFVWIASLILLFVSFPRTGYSATFPEKSSPLLPNDLTNYEEVELRFDEIQQFLHTSSAPVQSTTLLLNRMVEELKDRFGTSFSIVELCKILKEGIAHIEIENTTKGALVNAIDLLMNYESATTPLPTAFVGPLGTILAKDNDSFVSGEMLGAAAEGIIGVAIGTFFGWTGVGGAIAAFFIGDALTRAGKAGEIVYERNRPPH